MSNIINVKKLNIKEFIHTIRGTQVILDRDLANLYHIETRALKQAVNRNKKRFPNDFMFVLTNKEIEIMVSQNVIPSKLYLGGAFPFAFTEQGVAMLSGVLKSQKAIDVNIQIIRAFVSMRNFISKNAEIFMKLNNIEKKQIEYDKNFEILFKAIETNEIKQGIFFNGQVFDAYEFVCGLIRKAEKSIILIDNYIDDTVLTLFSKRKKSINVKIYTKISPQLILDLNKFNSQYEKIEIKEFSKSHDRFLIIDNNETYHIGASLKDLGKKWFAFSKIEKDSFKIIEKLKKE